MMGPAALVVRHDPTPVIAALGHFDEADLARLEFLARWLDGASGTLRYIDYTDVTGAVTQLADELRTLFGRDVRTFDFAAIPRGGLIVLGLLSYSLGLEGDPVQRSNDPDRPLVIVDDCSLTGSRFKRFIEGNSERKNIIFAHLCSTPHLRSAILEQEARVSHCLASIDLTDLAPERFGAEYDAWRSEVQSRVGQGRYWIGQTEEVAFPWNEPDHNFWNPVTESTEWGWTIVPPEKCLKNVRPADKPPIPVIDFQPVPGEYIVSDDILAARFDGSSHVVDTLTGASFSLAGVGADIWMWLTEGASLSEITTRVTDLYDVDVDQARADSEALVKQLVEAGVLISLQVSHARQT